MYLRRGLGMKYLRYFFAIIGFLIIIILIIGYGTYAATTIKPGILRIWSDNKIAGTSSKVSIAGTSTLIPAQKMNGRKYISITYSSSKNSTLYISSHSGVSSSNGYLIEDKENVTLHTEQDIYGVNAGLGGTNVYCFEGK